MKKLVSMRAALADPALLGGALPGDSWRPWRALLVAMFGEKLEPHERVIFRELTGREAEPECLVDEFVAVAGRRSGKTRAAGVASAYVACLCDHAHYLAPGERAVLPILAASTVQAARAFMHARGVIAHSPALSSLIEGEPTADTVRLKTRVDIETRPANFKTIRSITAPMAVADELAFWSNAEGAANLDTEILGALRPALATTGGPLLIISSPYSRRGELYGLWKSHYGPDGDPRIMVVQAGSRQLNPELPQRVIDRAIERDPAQASAEYGAQFRTDVETLLTREAVESCVDLGVFERPYVEGTKYSAALDASSGSGGDSAVVVIAHREGATAVIDAIYERRPPFRVEAFAEEASALIRRFGLSTATSDRWGLGWVSSRFAEAGVTVHTEAKAKSDLYREAVGVINSGRVALLDNQRLINQLVGLERRTARGGRDSIDHGPNQHDDIANAAALAVNLLLVQFKQKIPITAPIVVSGRGIGAPGSGYHSNRRFMF